jgi:PAS domain-containing protein
MAARVFACMLCACELASGTDGRPDCSCILSTFLGALRPEPVSFWEALIFEILCSAMAWLAGVSKHRWELIERERDEIRIMLDHAPVGVALFDINRKVLRCNPAFCDIYGFREAQIIGSIPPCRRVSAEAGTNLSRDCVLVSPS